MRRAGGLFDRAFTREDLFGAYQAASTSKRRRRACLMFGRHAGAEIDQLHAELHAETYRPRPYRAFLVREPKPRLIHAPAFRDCVVQHAAHRVVAPTLERALIDQSFACRVGFGTHRAADYAQRALQRSDPQLYLLKLDVRKFFYSVNRSILRGLLERRIKDRRMIEVLALLADHGEPNGIPIGGLLSQVFALTYLSPVDHFIKRTLQVRHYCRYVDDLLLIGLRREEAVEFRDRIAAFLRERLQLELSQAMIARVARGVNFVGYRTWADRRLVRRRALYTYRRGLRHSDLPAVASSLGHARRTHSLAHMLRYVREHHDALHLQLPAVYHA